MSKTIDKGLALVTGGSSGLGREYARQLAALGCDLILVSNQAEELEAVGRQLSADYGVEVVTHWADLALEDAADELFAWCNAGGYQVDILVSNAGIFFFGELTMENYGKATAMTNLHVVTPTRLCILFGNAMKERRHGTIISMSSLAARLPFPGISIYCASKAYLRVFGKAMYHELKPYGVNFTTVCPGGINTSLYGLRDDLMRLAVRLRVIKTPQWLVRKALRAAARGRKLLDPGLVDNLMPPMLDMFPDRIENKLWVKFKK